MPVFQTRKVYEIHFEHVVKYCPGIRNYKSTYNISTKSNSICQMQSSPPRLRVCQRHAMCYACDVTLPVNRNCHFHSTPHPHQNKLAVPSNWHTSNSKNKYANIMNTGGWNTCTYINNFYLVVKSDRTSYSTYSNRGINVVHIPV
jgi:hypothetical protein